MNAYNPLASMKRLEDAGLPRSQAEAIASEIGDGTSKLVTKDQLDASLDRMLIKMSVVVGAMITLACTFFGVFVSLHTGH